VADRIALIARALNNVKSVGESIAALRAADAEITRGYALADELSRWSSPTPAQARDKLAVYRGAIAAEIRLISPMGASSLIPADTWAGARSFIERVYIDVAGIEGAAGVVLAIDVAEILGNAIRNAPKVFGKALGNVAGGVGETVGHVGAGFLGGLGLWGFFLLALVVGVLWLKHKVL